MRILFMGTPDFAAASLKAMTDAGLDVVGVVSQPDRPKGRGHKLVPTDVKAAALEAGIENIYQPEKLRNGELQPVLDKLKPELIVVVAYGKILPDYIIDYPKYGCVNVHASLLPKYRGAGPIQWAIINGEKVTGVTTMKMDSGLDTGDILLKAETEIGEYETAEELFDRLAVIGGDLLLKTIDGLELPVASINTKKFYEVADYLSATDHMFTAYAVCISGNFWNKLTEEEQAWFQEAADLATEEERVHVQNVEQQFLDEMIEKGLIYNEVENIDEIVATCEKTWVNYVDTIGEDRYNLILEKLGRN